VHNAQCIRVGGHVSFGGIWMEGRYQYYWVVLCKNHRFHKRQNLFFAHKIPLAETDAFLPPPVLNGSVKVRCDECGQAYSYEAKELVRIQLECPASFAPHPLFQ
jgi:hypothetical protein